MMMIRRRRPTAILDEVDVHGADFDVDGRCYSSWPKLAVVRHPSEMRSGMAGRRGQCGGKDCGGKSSARRWRGPSRQ